MEFLLRQLLDWIHEAPPAANSAEHVEENAIIGILALECMFALCFYLYIWSRVLQAAYESCAHPASSIFLFSYIPDGICGLLFKFEILIKSQLYVHNLFCLMYLLLAAVVFNIMSALHHFQRTRMTSKYKTRERPRVIVYRSCLNMHEIRKNVLSSPSLQFNQNLNC